MGRSNSEIRKYAFLNTSGEEIPPFACMEITGSVDDALEIIFEVDKPSYALEQSQKVSQMMFNSAFPISADGKGLGTFDVPCQAAVDGDVQPGDEVGPTEGSWLLVPERPAFCFKCWDDCDPWRVSATERTAWIESNSTRTYMVLVTSATPTDGYYDGEIQRFDTATQSWITVASCKVVDANA